MESKFLALLCYRSEVGNEFPGAQIRELTRLSLLEGLRTFVAWVFSCSLWGSTYLLYLWPPSSSLREARALQQLPASLPLTSIPGITEAQQRLPEKASCLDP